MATSAFKSTTKRTPIGAKSSSDDSSSSSAKPHRRSRSLSRFSHHLPDSGFRDAPPARGKFVNTIRGSDFPEISLDDLAVEFFPSKSELDDERETDRRRLSRRSSGISPATNQTPVSQRRGRSVSRHSARDSDGKSGVYDNSNDASLRRRRSVSVARCRISDSENDLDHSQRSSNHANLKNIRNGRISNPHKPTSDRRLGRSYSQTDLLRSHDGYSSHSSAVTDDDAKDAHYGDNGVEKTIRAVYAQKKAEHPIGEDVNGGLFQAMRKELRYAVEEIRTELEQVMVNGSSTLDSGDSFKSSEANLQAVSAITRNYASKLEQSEKRKKDLLAEILLEEHRGKELSKIVNELLPQSRSNTIEQKPLRARKRSNDKNRMSKQLTKEAEKYFEDFLSNVEDTDKSSIDGERSDASSSLGGMSKQKEFTPHSLDIIENNLSRARAGYNSQPVATDGVILPWLQWETSNDGSAPSKSKTQLPVTRTTIPCDAAQASNRYPCSSQTSWNAGLVSHLINIEKDGPKFKEDNSSQQQRFDMDEYLEVQKNEELLFERWRQRDRISSGWLLLCGNHLRF